VFPVGNFSNALTSVEYLLALSGELTPFSPPSGRIFGIELTHFMVQGNTVFVRAYVSIDSPEQRGVAVEILQAQGLFLFNPQNKITRYDLYVENAGQAFPSLDPETAIPGICQLALALCQGPNQIFDNFTDCTEFLQSIPVGSGYNFMTNSVLCRSVHVLLAQLRPDLHCPHVSKSGGYTCVDFSYQQFLDASHSIIPPNLQ